MRQDLLEVKESGTAREPMLTVRCWARRMKQRILHIGCTEQPTIRIDAPTAPPKRMCCCR
jgi:hypothetical protein